MISAKTKAVADWLVRNGAIKKSETELYQYAIESLFLSMMTIVFALLIGLLLGNVVQGIVVIMPFMFLRKFSGGYHAKNLLACILGSSLLMLLSLSLSINIHCDMRLAVITVMSVISMSIFSPIENSNRALQDQERKRFRKMTICLLMIFLLLSVITYYFGLTGFTKSICIGVQLSAVLQIPCILKRIICKNPMDLRKQEM